MFDIEEKMEAIQDPKTKEFFKEVYSSYQHGNYRSAVVMLWAVVISDIIFKLKFLDDTYRNKKAEKILKEIKEKQKENPVDSKWEKDILEKAYVELKFITLNEKNDLEYLHKQRNFSAHPVLTDDNLLLAPNKDTTRSLIRNAMEAVLLKTPLLHCELVNSIVEDLDKNKDRLSSYENIKPYIQKRYFPNISNDGAIKIFKALWRFIFDTRNQDEDKNRQINFFALSVFVERYQDLYISEIKKNTSYYQVSPEYIERIILFLKKHPQIYQVLDESVKTLIKSSVKKLDQFFISDFLSSNLEEHYNTVLSRLNSEDLSVSQENLKICFEIAKEKNMLSNFFEICIKLYSKSINFDKADYNYYQYISPFLSEYTLNDILLLMRETNDKTQVCNRNRAYFDHNNVIKKFYALGGKTESLCEFKNWKEWDHKFRESKDISQNSPDIMENNKHD